jgi:hypothetical protein
MKARVQKNKSSSRTATVVPQTAPSARLMVTDGRRLGFPKSIQARWRILTRVWFHGWCGRRWKNGGDERGWREDNAGDDVRGGGGDGDGVDAKAAHKWVGVEDWFFHFAK